MSSRRDLERRLSGLRGFDRPRLDLEQYSTPAPLAASLLHRADLHGDVAGQTVLDLGTGTGVLAIGAALRGADTVIGLELDPGPLAIARQNAASTDPPVAVDWVLADTATAPICPPTPVTVVMNPPFGAQRGNVHADRPFLATAGALAAVSYSIHNAGSRTFVESFAGDHGGTVTHAFGATLTLDRRFPHQSAGTAEIEAEVFRIEWRDGAGDPQSS